MICHVDKYDNIDKLTACKTGIGHVEAVCQELILCSQLYFLTGRYVTDRYDIVRYDIVRYEKAVIISGNFSFVRIFDYITSN